jgi:hypothetical protein
MSPCFQAVGRSPHRHLRARHRSIVEEPLSSIPTLAIREVSGGDGFASQSPQIQLFGLASAWGAGDGPYTVRVRFISGAVVTVTNVVPVSSTITVGSTVLSNTIEVQE